MKNKWKKKKWKKKNEKMKKKEIVIEKLLSRNEKFSEIVLFCAAVKETF